LKWFGGWHRRRSRRVRGSGSLRGVGEHTPPDDALVVLPPGGAGDQGELGVGGRPQLNDPRRREHPPARDPVMPDLARSILDIDDVADRELVDVLEVRFAMEGDDVVAGLSRCRRSLVVDHRPPLQEVPGAVTGDAGVGELREAREGHHRVGVRRRSRTAAWRRTRVRGCTRHGLRPAMVPQGQRVVVHAAAPQDAEHRDEDDRDADREHGRPDHHGEHPSAWADALTEPQSHDAPLPAERGG